jgi:hypothetical protein
MPGLANPDKASDGVNMPLISNTPNRILSGRKVVAGERAVQDWCKRSGFNASHFLLPLSYASIMGGTCTLISMFPIAMSGAQSLDVSTDNNW